MALIPDVVVPEAEPGFPSGLSPIARILSQGNPLGSGGQAYWLAACTRQVTSASYLQGLMSMAVPPTNLLHPGVETSLLVRD